MKGSRRARRICGAGLRGRGKSDGGVKEGRGESLIEGYSRNSEGMERESGRNSIDLAFSNVNTSRMKGDESGVEEISNLSF